jgi:hypothetical protein
MANTLQVPPEHDDGYDLNPEQENLFSRPNKGPHSFNSTGSRRITRALSSAKAHELR